jgi:hypothetical protein
MSTGSRRFALAAWFLALLSPLGATSCEGADPLTEPRMYRPLDPVVSVEPSEVSLTVGESVQLQAIVAGVRGIFRPEITWTSSDPGVADVSSNGVVTAGAEGLAVITATLGSRSASARAVVGRPRVLF